jgi:hypothetical protein
MKKLTDAEKYQQLKAQTEKEENGEDRKAIQAPFDALGPEFSGVGRSPSSFAAPSTSPLRDSSQCLSGDDCAGG